MDHDKEFSNRRPEPIQETEEDLCRALWLAVTVQALIDASGKGGNHIDQARAKEWFAGRGGIGSDFTTVCDLAGIDPDRTQKRFREILRGNAGQIDFRCMKKAYLKNRNRKRFFRKAEKNARLRREKILRFESREQSDDAKTDEIDAATRLAA